MFGSSNLARNRGEPRRAPGLTQLRVVGDAPPSSLCVTYSVAELIRRLSVGARCQLPAACVPATGLRPLPESLTRHHELDCHTEPPFLGQLGVGLRGGWPTPSLPAWSHPAVARSMEPGRVMERGTPGANKEISQSARSGAYRAGMVVAQLIRSRSHTPPFTKD